MSEMIVKEYTFFFWVFHDILVGYFPMQYMIDFTDYLYLFLFAYSVELV